MADKNKKMSRQRKCLLAVLGLGVMAVVVDRALMGGPETATASEEAAPASDAALEPVAADTETPAPVATSNGPVDLSDFADRLDELSAVVDADHARADAFTPPADWAPAPLEVQPETLTAPIADGELGRVFQNKYTHNGTMNFNGVEYVILNGQRVAEGEVIDSFVLVEFIGHASLWESTQTLEQVVLRRPGTTPR